MKCGFKRNLFYALSLLAIGCGSESDLQTREGTENAQGAKPAQEQRANHSTQNPGDDDEHGAPSTKTLVQWKLESGPATSGRKHLSVLLTVAGTQTDVEVGPAKGSCNTAEPQGELGRLRCINGDRVFDFVVQKEGSGLAVYKKADAAPKSEQVARVALAEGTKIEYRPGVLVVDRHH